MEETLAWRRLAVALLARLGPDPTPERAPFISFRILCMGVAAETGGPPSIPLSDFPGRIIGPPELPRNRRQPDCRGLPLKAL